jgi:hypothetical protein
MLKSTVLKDIHLTVLPSHTPEQLLSFCASLHPRWAELTKGLASGDLQAVCAELIAKQALKETYFHAKQKAEQVRLVGRMLRTLYPEPSQAEPLTLEVIKAQVAELQQPVPAPAEAKEAEEEPEEGAIEEGELPDEEAEPAAPKMVPRKLPPAVSEGLAAWSLLECPPIPPPGADPTAPPPATPQPPYSTDEYIREALEAFKAQRRKEADSTGADSTAMSDERKEGSSTAAAAASAGSKRRRSRSRSASPARSKQRREEPADEKASAAPSSAAAAASSTPAAAMEDTEEGELPDE